MGASASMSPAQRLTAVFAGGAADRAPVMPKIWLDLAARLTSTELRRAIEDPWLAMRTVIDAALLTRSDGARLFLFPARRTVEEHQQLFEVDQSGGRLGRIDLQGGLATQLDRLEDFQLDNPRHVAFRTSWRHEAPLVKDLADVRRMAVPESSFYQAAGYGDLIRRAQAHAGDRVGLCGDCDSATLAFCVSLRGMHQTLIDLIDSPKLIHALMERGEAYAIERGKFLLDAGLRILRFNDSVANMSVISPRQWGEFVFPHMKTVCDELHRHCPAARIYCHICGNVLPIARRLLEAGLDCIAPLDPLGGFTVADVRRAVGDEIVLMGGVNALSFLQASSSEIRQESLQCLEQGDRNGRFILGSGCALPSQSRRENIEALAAAAESFADRRV